MGEDVMQPLDAMRAIWSPDHALTTGERAVLTTLVLHSNNVTGRCFPGQTRIAAAIGAGSLNGVRPHIRRLLQRGIVSRKQDDGRAPDYTLHLDRLGGVIIDTGSENAPVQKREGEGFKKGRGGVQNLNGGGAKIEPELLSNWSITDEGVTRAVTRFCERTGAVWKLRSKTPSQFCAEIVAAYPKIDIAAELERAADYYDAESKKVRSPDRAIRNWLDRAKPSRNGSGAPGREGDFLRKLEEELR
jgi:hypothetical protein